MSHLAARGTLALILGAALSLALLGTVLVTSVSPWPDGDVLHFPLRHVLALLGAVLVTLALSRCRTSTLLRGAPLFGAAALLAVGAVFVPGLGIHAGGAHRWLRFGPASFAPAPFLVWGAGLWVVAWAPVSAAPGHVGSSPRRALGLALALALAAALAVLLLEPDFSAAGILLATVLAALGGLGWARRRLAVLALLAAGSLVLVASRFPYVESRIAGFRAPGADRRGKGFEVLALERSSLQTAGRGLGRGRARHVLSSPASDYAFAVAREELGRAGAGFLLGAAILELGAALALARLAARRGPRLAALAATSGAALATPALMHVAVCSGLVPIVGVSWPFVSYDPAATVAAGLSLGTLVAVAAETE